MKRIYFIIALLFLTVSSNAQTTGQNWTKNDCNGNSHNLFAELDSGYVVILEFVMIPSCQSCIIASHTVQPMISRLKAASNNMVRYYAIGYTNAYTCTQMKSWATTQNILASSVFDKGASDVSYYGGMGMPTIVVLGKGHRVTYKKQGFATDDTTAIRNSIVDAFNWGTGINDKEVQRATVTVSPNPVQTNVNIAVNMTTSQNVIITICDIFGKEIMQMNFDTLESGEHSLVTPIDRTIVSNGVYFIRTNIGSTPVKFFVSN